jgi:hypothetical protein
MTGILLDGGTYHAMLLPIGSLAILVLAAIAFAFWITPLFATFAYLLMIPIGRISRRVASRSRASKKY